jgi:hypothetical protein
MGTVQGTTRELWNCEGLNPCGQPELMPGKRVKNRFSGSAQLSGSKAELSPKGHRPLTPIHDANIVYQVLTKDPKETTYSHCQNKTGGDWTERDDAELEEAVRKVSSLKQIKLPRYDDLNKDLTDGEFADDTSRDYWHCVSMRVGFRDAAACFLRYKAMHGSVARFTAPSRLGRGSRRR